MTRQLLRNRQDKATFGLPWHHTVQSAISEIRGWVKLEDPKIPYIPL